MIRTPSSSSADSEPDTWEYGGWVEVGIPAHDMFWDTHLQVALALCAAGRLVRNSSRRFLDPDRPFEDGDVIISNFRGPFVPTGCWEHNGHDLDPMDLHLLETLSPHI